jgi:uncharacterized membrane protein YbhN (UPF0104 family)
MSSTANPSARKKWLIRAIKLLIVVLVIWAVRRTVYKAWNQLDDYQWELRPGWLAASVVLYLGGLLPAGLFWYRVLRTLGQNARLGETLRAYYVGHLGKYVPGKAMVVVIRAGLIRGRGVSTGLAAASVFVETLTMMAVGAFLGAAILAIQFRGHGMMLYGAVGLTILAMLPTLPPVFRRLASLAGIGKSDPASRQKLDWLGLGTLLQGWFLTAVGWFILGLSYWATLRAMGLSGLEPISELPRYTAAVALATVTGFLILVLPGGIGIREAALVGLMLPYLEKLVPQAALTAWASAALLRLVWLGAELMVAGFCLLPVGHFFPPRRDA